MTNHLHHEDGAFQQFVALDGDNLTILPDDIDPVEIGPVLCAGITAYKVCRMCLELSETSIMIDGFELILYSVISA